VGELKFDFFDNICTYVHAYVHMYLFLFMSWLIWHVQFGCGIISGWPKWLWLPHTFRNGRKTAPHASFMWPQQNLSSHCLHIDRVTPLTHQVCSENAKVKNTLE